MIANILTLLVVLALAILFAWLTYRAVRAQRLWVKIAGGLLAGLVTILLVAVTFLGGKGIAVSYFPGMPEAPELTVAGTADQVARGEYLANLSCIGCHSAVDANGEPGGEHPLTGGWNIAEAEGFGFMGSMVTENLTPGGKLANYSDGDLFRVLRHGVNQDGVILGFMGLLPYKELSDADVEAIIAYLRSLEPVATDVETGDDFNFAGAVLMGSGMFPPASPGAASITAPPAGVTAEYGRYIATFGECRGCHGPDMTGTEASALGPAVPNPRPLISELDRAAFAAMMRSGVKPGGTPFPETMPWQNAAKMTDDDLAALYLYLTTQP